MFLFTIGHSNCEIESFLQRLKEHGISYVVDVRSSPSSRFQHFNRGPLERVLRQAGIAYYFYGDLLGGKIGEGSATNRAWKQGTLDPGIVKELRSSNRWKLGLEKLAELLRRESTVGASGCLLCSEADPNNCHRLAIAFDLAGMLNDLDVHHVGPSSSSKVEVRLQEHLLDP